MKISLLPAVAALTLAGCVIAPAPVAYQAQRYEQAPAPAYDQYVPPPEYIEGGAPVYYDTEPGVAFYPIFLDVPGSCFCIVPMRFYNGVWLGIGGTVLYRGHFALHHAPQDRRDFWIRSGGVVNGYAPVHGRIEHEGGAMRPVPPVESIHARPSLPPQQQQNWQQQGRQPEHEQVRERDQYREHEPAREHEHEREGEHEHGREGERY